MMRHRTSAPEGESSSSDEEDAFSALSRKSKQQSKKSPQASNTTSKATELESSAPHEENSKLSEKPFPLQSQMPSRNSHQGKEMKQLPASITSSMKRHHGAISDSRKAKMDALLMELQTTDPKEESSSYAPPKGSFVQPGEEHVTTNLFVGGLAPSITEEQLESCFSQFGELYSVKIMWARTAEGKSRNRHSGFVCFMNRPDAEDAIEALDETDPFNVGRRIMVRWGKHVKKVVKQDAPLPARTDPTVNVSTPTPVVVAPTDSNGPRIQVVIPNDPQRAHFISTIASFVAKDGSNLERRLLEREANNPQFAFLYPSNSVERIYYQWRVYAFCQGDGFYSWRTEPFVMFKPHGCVWVPPALDNEAALKERQREEYRAETLRRQNEQRRLQHAHRAHATGRQLEHLRKRGAAGKVDGGAQLSREEMADFDRLFRQELCASRGSICNAMAFAFEKSAASTQISFLLKELLLEHGENVKVETKIAQLYVLSDILFNSQQPGVRNAFRYRDAIEKLCPQVFASLGDHSRDLGRMTRNKLATAVSSVLGAWTNWSVYSPQFLDELQARFEGREILAESSSGPNPDVVDEEKVSIPVRDDSEVQKDDTEEQKATELKPKGDWSTVPVDAPGELSDQPQEHDNDDDADGEPMDDSEVDGVNLEDDEDGMPLNDEDLEGGETCDGIPLDDEDEDVDGVPLDSDNPI